MNADKILFIGTGLVLIIIIIIFVLTYLNEKMSEPNGTSRGCK